MPNRLSNPSDRLQSRLWLQPTTKRKARPPQTQGIGPQTLKNFRLARAARLAGLDSDGQRIPTFHELRHAHASAWIAAGGDLVELSARLGHRDPAITAAIYSHDFEAQARSSERRTRLDAMYGADDGSDVAATEVNGRQQPRSDTDPEVADLQAIREKRQ